MTEEYLKYVKDCYDDWCKREIERIEKHNSEVNDKVILYNKIHELLNDENVREFADLIKYEEGNRPTNFEEIDTSLTKFLNRRLFDIPNMTLKQYLKFDKNPVFCFVKTKEEHYVIKKTSYDDIYYSLEFKGHGFAVSGSNRDKFKDSFDIIYAPEGKSFNDNDTFYSIQAEYVEESLKTNQDNAKKLVLSKYGRK